MEEDQESETSIEDLVSNLNIESRDEEKNLEAELLNHVLLPRFLPQMKHNESYEHELELLQRMVDVVELHDEWIPEQTIDTLRHMSLIQTDCSAETIYERINSLTPGKTFAMFVKDQNCMFVIYMPANDSTEMTDGTKMKWVIVATFPGNFDCKDINRTIGDYEFNYPVQALKVKFTDLIRSKEFAHQLWTLHNEKLTHSTSFDLASKWLVTTLCDQDTTTASINECPVIVKKLRDEALGKHSKFIFRRSRLYMCVKALLQHNLTIQKGANTGKLLYKAIMLQFITKMFDSFKPPDSKSLDIGVMIQMMAKLARRIEKLNQLSDDVNDECDNINEYITSSICNAKTSIKNMRRKIDSEISKLQNEDEKSAKLPPLTELNFEMDANQKVPELREYLNHRTSETGEHMNYLRETKKYERHDFDEYAAPPSNYFDMHGNIDKTEKYLKLADFEKWALYAMDFNEIESNGIELIRKHSITYTAIAAPLYEGDPIRTSIMVLVNLKLISMLDRLVIESIPLFKDHRSGINPHIIKTLLLPHRADMAIASELEDYFTKRNEEASGPSLIEEKTITCHSFSSKFAAQSEIMQGVRNTVLKETEDSIEQLERQWNQAVREVEKLRFRMRGLHHEKFLSKRGLYTCGSYCELCSLKKDIKGKKLKPYVKSLPEEEFKQNAVVFELLIPDSIAYLRDVLYNFAEFCNGKQSDSLKIKSDWIDFEQINSFKPSWTFRRTTFIALGSTTIEENRPLHVDKPFSNFALENSYNLTVYKTESTKPNTNFNHLMLDISNRKKKKQRMKEMRIEMHSKNTTGFSMPDPITDDAVKMRCTLKVESGTDYEHLQWVVNGTSHFQNEVIAEQAKCPDGLSLAEFKNFGSLRADGHRLQLRKLYAMIENEGLSFEKPSVLSLVLQTIWECEVKGDAGETRESHVFFQRSACANSMILTLEKFVELQKENWVHPLKLLMASFITVRVMEINEDEEIVDNIVKLLDKLRFTALDWINRIQKAICELRTPDQTMEQDLRMKLALVSIAGAVTFFVHPDHRFFDKILQTNTQNHYSAPRQWLEFIVILNNNILLSEGMQHDSMLNIKMLLQMVLRIGTQIQPNIKKLISENSSDLTEFIKKQWRRADESTLESQYFDGDCPQMWLTQINQKLVNIDIVTGSFLVNNMPVARLPKKISESRLYQRVFQNFIFEVQPEDANTFVSVHQFSDCAYKFSWIENQVVITECRGDGTEQELLPDDVLKNELPYLMVQNYSHWWRKDEDIVDFRPKLFSAKNFAAIEYNLDLDQNYLWHQKTQRSLLDVTSDSYRKIVNQLSRLECSDFINILVEISPSDQRKIAIVELPRMNLKFRVVTAAPDAKEYFILSEEFSQMRVSLQQKCGTLFGLNHGLLLEKCDSAKQPTLLLLPHGTILAERTSNHVFAQVDTRRDLLSPPFHLYRIDESCRQLKAINNSYSAWFYLAYLHAITSHGEIEPLTGVSGTESAMQILQSGYAWSSSPYDPEAIQLLRKFAELTPKRQSKNGMSQSVEWPTFIQPNAAQDSYVFLVKKLLDDSQRLHKLYFVDDLSIDFKTDLALNKREYLRHSELLPNLRVSDTFIQHEIIRTSLPKISDEKLSKRSQMLSILYHKNGFTVIPDDFDLWNFLTEKKKSLMGPIYGEELPSLLNHRSIDHFINLWISLYEAARNGQFNDEEFTLIWNLLSHKNDENIDAILALQAIQMNREKFTNIKAPHIEEYDLKEGLYDKDEVAKLLKKCDFGYTSSIRKENLIEKITNDIDLEWPCESFDLPEDSYSEIYYSYDLYSTNEAINHKLSQWYNNYQLKQFVEQVEELLRSLKPISTEIHPIPNLSSFAYNKPDEKNWPRYHVNFDAKMAKIPSKFTNEFNEAKIVWENKSDSKKSSQQWWDLYNKIIEKQIEKYFIDARMHPRSVPTLVLPKLLSQNTNEKMKFTIGALAISIAKEQREKRIELLKHREQLKSNLKREEENVPHMNWNPWEYPEWLLFEIEQNLTIRRIQIEVAKRMINPPEINVKHSTMQLNMGEGKTAVIVPILAAVLADAKQVCQITVLKSLFATNLKSLRHYLGGMLNRRIYIFPCRRDMRIDEHIDDILKIYEECKRNKGVVMSLSEHQLSFQLKMYELIQKKDLDIAKEFQSVQKWLNTNIRNILDESDAILQPKYQLIYTVGNQLSLDGHVQRWHVMQAVLKRIPHHMETLYRDHGEKAIEFNEEYLENGPVYGAPKIKYRPDVFTPCRIIEPIIYEKLNKAIIDDIFSGKLDITLPEMDATTESKVKQFLTQSDGSFETFCNDLSVDVQNTILIFNGLLQFDVIKLMLQKRWRVNYGINKKGPRKMAVPFRAKDVAAELTEFGHPDVAIGFTQLSYYYSGLTDVQLQQVFRVLAATQNASDEYKKWIEKIPCDIIDPSINEYTRVNLCDPNQRDNLLFPLFRYNMYAIDFWLSKYVFPNEAKTFENKLMCTAWDLCSEEMNHRVTGFSGTNDTKNILPLPIAQNDLPELEKTNENVRKILVHEKNQNYESLPPNVSAKYILDLLVHPINDIPVLLDPGALMLELSNKHVAEKWLELAPPKYKAAVYFDAFDVLQTIDRTGTIAEFDCSVYRENLDRCLVYLDDTHTRGTDLKFPSNWKSCVTLSGEITRDKTVQACMRMRELEEGQSIAFWASYEADLRIRDTISYQYKEPSNEDVIKFIQNNSLRFEQENTIHWAYAAHNYTKKLAACKLYQESNNLMDLYKGCEDKEYVTLRETYSDKKEETLKNLSLNKFNKLYRSYFKNDSIRTFIQHTYTAVSDRLSGEAGNIKRCVYMMDEEQEKEIDYEPEQQRQIERPAAVKPYSNVNLNFEELKHLILHGINIQTNQMIRQILFPLENALTNTKLFKEYASDDYAFAKHIYVTHDFIHVIETPSQACDEFLRPVWWIARVDSNNNSGYILILLSSLQCNNLLPSIKKSEMTTLYMFNPLLNKMHSELIDNVDLRITGKIRSNTTEIADDDLAQIKIFSGSSYFRNQSQQNAYCNILGLIPRPRTAILEKAFEIQIIKPNGYVPYENRQSAYMSDCVGKCKFKRNPVNLATKLITAHHQFIRKESHAALILERGMKSQLPI